MFNQLLFIHLYRPFLKYSRANTPLPSHVSPRKICTQAASAISKLLRMYKRTYGLRQICNIVVYIAHTACTIHLLNLPQKNAQRDIIHGLRNLEEMAEGWPCARRTLRILDLSALKWQVNLPSEATAILWRSHNKWGSWGSWDHSASPTASDDSQMVHFNLKSAVTTPSQSSPPPRARPIPSTAASNSTAKINFNLLASSIELIGDTRHTEAPPQFSRPLPSAAGQFSGIVSHESRDLRPSMNSQSSLTGPSSMRHAEPGWFDAVTPLLSSQTAPQPDTSYSDTASSGVVEGSQPVVNTGQEWWSRDSFGLETWPGLWNVGTANPSPNAPYEGDQSYPLATAQPPATSFPPPHQAQLTVPVPPGSRTLGSQVNSTINDEPWE